MGKHRKGFFVNCVEVYKGAAETGNRLNCRASIVHALYKRSAFEAGGCIRTDIGQKSKWQNNTQE